MMSATGVISQLFYFACVTSFSCRFSSWLVLTDGPDHHLSICVIESIEQIICFNLWKFVFFSFYALCSL